MRLEPGGGGGGAGNETGVWGAILGMRLEPGGLGGEAGNETGAWGYPWNEPGAIL